VDYVVLVKVLDAGQELQGVAADLEFGEAAPAALEFCGRGKVVHLRVWFWQSYIIM
jgi:hypothetical protein